MVQPVIIIIQMVVPILIRTGKTRKIRMVILMLVTEMHAICVVKRDMLRLVIVQIIKIRVELNNLDKSLLIIIFYFINLTD